MPLTTGLITNTRDFGTAATNVVVNLVNELSLIHISEPMKILPQVLVLK